MRAHALILAALSASALGLTLTAKKSTDSTCTGPSIGNDITLSLDNCQIYQPEEDDAYIYATWYESEYGPAYNITIYSDTKCENEIADIGQSRATVDSGGGADCYSMASIATGPWGGAKIGPLSTLSGW